MTSYLDASVVVNARGAGFGRAKAEGFVVDSSTLLGRLLPARAAATVKVPNESVVEDRKKKTLDDLRDATDWVGQFLKCPAEGEPWKHLLQALAGVLTIQADNPAVRVTVMREMTTKMLVLRLLCYFLTDQGPLRESLAQGPSTAPDKDLAHKLGFYLGFIKNDQPYGLACLQYLCNPAYPEKDLQVKLEETAEKYAGRYGKPAGTYKFSLLHSSFDQELIVTDGSGLPAFFVCTVEDSTDPGRKEVVVSVRGTETMEDALYDIDGTAKVLEGTKTHCHKAMACLAENLGKYLLATPFKNSPEGRTLKGYYEAGYAITITGHSLGAGVSSLLAVYLRAKGFKKGLSCWAYETPACMDVALAKDPTVKAIVTSVVNGDDVVPRLSVSCVLGLLYTLGNMDLVASLTEVIDNGCEAGNNFALKLAAYLVKDIMLSLPLAAAASFKASLPPKLSWVAGLVDKGTQTADAGLKVVYKLADKNLQAVRAVGRAGMSLALRAAALPIRLMQVSTGHLVGLVASHQNALLQDIVSKAGLDTVVGDGHLYRAQVPGRVVLLYPESQDAGGDTCPPGMAVVDCDHPAVTTMRVSSSIVGDHSPRNVMKALASAARAARLA